MTKSHDQMTKAQHMASCDLATPFLFHIEDPEPWSTQHDLMLPDPHQSEALCTSSYLLLSAYRNKFHISDRSLSVILCFHHRYHEEQYF